MSRQLRLNVRNFLLPMTVAEIRHELELSVEADDTARAGYVEEFLREVEVDDRDQENPCEYSEDYDWDGYDWDNDPDWQ